MRNILITILTIATVFFSSCIINPGKRVKGNGKIESEDRKVSSASRIKVSGSMDVYITEGPTAVRVEADENLLRYIVTEVNKGWLEIRTRDHVNINTDNSIKVYVTTPNLNGINVAGSGNVISNSKMTAEGPVEVKVSGSGDVTVMVNTPSVNADIAGSGNVNISGETRDVDIDIAGAGNFKGSDLKAENVKVKIAGSGDVEVFADVKLDAKIVGSGNIAYRGNANVDQKVIGSGDIRRMQ